MKNIVILTSAIVLALLMCCNVQQPLLVQSTSTGYSPQFTTTMPSFNCYL